MIRADELPEDDPRRSFLGLVFGLPERTHRRADDFPIKIDLDAEIELTSPVFPPIDESFQDHVETVRAAVIAGPRLETDRESLSQDAGTLGRIVRDQITKYAKPRDEGKEHLYVLEFQGRRQYIKFGRSRDLYRRVSDQLRGANLHGYALLNGWASPGVEDAGIVERPALIAARWTHGATHEGERFFDMPFKQALSIARAAYELRSH